MEKTRDKIIYQALTLFSIRGYEGISMRDIASAVGIKASSLYNHFKSKEDIFKSIFDEMSKSYMELVGKMQLPYEKTDEIADKYMQLSEEILLVIIKEIFLFFLNDDFASKFRRMLTIEQFQCKQAKDAFLKFLIDDPIDFQKMLFGDMIEQGGFLMCDSYIMAIHFYSPIFMILSKYDHLPDKEEEAIDILENHVRQFNYIYKNIGSDSTA